MARNQISKQDLLVVKVLERDGHLVLAFLIEDYLESSSVVIDLEAGAHGLLNLVGDSPHNYDLTKKSARATRRLIGKRSKANLEPRKSANQDLAGRISCAHLHR